jgi:hypothetical protein
MFRLTLALAVWIGLVSAAPAGLASRQDGPRSPNIAPRLLASRPWAQARQQAPAPGAATEYTVTEKTEVLLDGKACRYEAVPANAVIERMEVAPDGKTVLRVYFRTGK